MKRSAHAFLYYFRMLIRDRSQLFWCLLFPILLSTMFHFAFSGFASSSDFHPIPVAVSSEAAVPSFVRSVFDDSLSQILDTTWVSSPEDGEELLREKKVSGAMNLAEDFSLQLTVGPGSSLDTSILESVAENFNVIRGSFIQAYDSHGIAGILKTLAAMPRGAEDYVSHDTGAQEVDTDYAKINFYSLIGMFCLFADMGGLAAVIFSQANLSPLGLRTSLTSSSHTQVLGGFLLAALAVQYVCILAGLAWMQLVLKVNFGSSAPAVLLIALSGCVTGVCLGFFVGSIGGMKESTKNAILMVIVFGCSASAGLFGSGGTIQLEHTAPVLNRLNPVTMITDALYACALNGGAARYRKDICWLLLMAAIFFAGGIWMQKKKQFESL